MRPRSLLVLIAGLVVAMAVPLAQGQEEHEGESPAGMTPPTPGPEHKLLDKYVGTWDAVVKMNPGPGIPEGSVSKGVETVTKTCGGLWYLSDFEGEMMGKPFSGHGVYGYDTTKKKYVGVWVDSWATNVMTSEGTYDESERKFVSSSEEPGGQPMKMIDEFSSDDARTSTFLMVGPDGKEAVTMTIEYTRRKPEAETPGADH